MKLGVIGTSRVHEPLEWAGAGGFVDPIFFHCGYFHSPRQIRQLAEVATGETVLTESQRRFFFRRDGLRKNSFDERFWAVRGAQADAACGELRERFEAVDVFLIEISSLEEFDWDGLSVQGNPNVERSVAYAEVWREGYYHHYEPGLGVEKVHAGPEAAHDSLVRIQQVLRKPLIVVPHLVPSVGGVNARSEVWKVVRDAARATDIPFIDTRPLVDEFGFRRLQDGSIDIHHLPVDGCMAFAGTVVRCLQEMRGYHVFSVD